MQIKSKIILTIKFTIFCVKLFALLFTAVGTLLVFSIIYSPFGFFIIPIGIALYEQIPKYLNRRLKRKLLLLDSENSLDDKN